MAKFAQAAQRIELTSITEVELRSVARFINGFAFKTDTWEGTGKPIIRIQNLTGSSSKFNYFRGEVDERYLVRPGDILVSWSASLDVFLWQGPEAWLNQHIFKVVDIEPGVDREYLYFALKARIADIRSKTHGSTMKHVTRRDFLASRIPLPSLSTQRAIVPVLRAIYQSKAAIERVIAATRELKRSLVRHLFTFGPVPVTKADEGELKRTEFGPVPVRWLVRLLAECADIQTGVTKGRRLKGSDVIEVPYLRVANVQDGYIDVKQIKTIEIRKSEVNRYRLRPGDVLLTEGGDIDKLGRGHIWRGEIDFCVHQNHIFAVRPHPEVLSSEYFAFLVQSPYGKAYFLKVGHRTTNLASINRTKLAGFPVLIPSPDEQRAIVDLIGGIERKLAYEQRRRDALVRVFDALLRDLMTGKRRIGLPEAPRG